MNQRKGILRGESPASQKRKTHALVGSRNNERRGNGGGGRGELNGGGVGTLLGARRRSFGNEQRKKKGGAACRETVSEGCSSSLVVSRKDGEKG